MRKIKMIEMFGFSRGGGEFYIDGEVGFACISNSPLKLPEMETLGKKNAKSYCASQLPEKRPDDIAVFWLPACSALAIIILRGGHSLFCFQEETDNYVKIRGEFAGNIKLKPGDRLCLLSGKVVSLFGSEHEISTFIEGLRVFGAGTCAEMIVEAAQNRECYLNRPPGKKVAVVVDIH